VIENKIVGPDSGRKIVNRLKMQVLEQHCSNRVSIVVSDFETNRLYLGGYTS